VSTTSATSATTRCDRGCGSPRCRATSRVSPIPRSRSCACVDVSVACPRPSAITPLCGTGRCGKSSTRPFDSTLATRRRRCRPRRTADLCSIAGTPPETTESRCTGQFRQPVRYIVRVPLGIRTPESPALIDQSDGWANGYRILIRDRRLATINGCGILSNQGDSAYLVEHE